MYEWGTQCHTCGGTKCIIMVHSIAYGCTYLGRASSNDHSLDRLKLKATLASHNFSNCNLAQTCWKRQREHRGNHAKHPLWVEMGAKLCEICLQFVCYNLYLKLTRHQNLHDTKVHIHFIGFQVNQLTSNWWMDYTKHNLVWQSLICCV